MKTIVFIIVALSLFFPTVLLSQWQQTNGPFGGAPVYSMTVDGTILFAGTNAGVYRSTNNGALWTDAKLTNMTVNALFVDGTFLFAGTTVGVYRSEDHGLTWTEVNVGLTDLKINTFAAGAGILYAGTERGMFKSSNVGASWQTTGALPWPVVSIIVTKDAAGGPLVYAGCRSTSESGLFLSTDAGMTWTKLAIPSDEKFIEFDGELTAVRDTLYAGARTICSFGTLGTWADDDGKRIYSCDPKINPRNWGRFSVLASKYGLTLDVGGYRDFFGRWHVTYIEGENLSVTNGRPVEIVRYGGSHMTRLYVQATGRVEYGGGIVYRADDSVTWSGKYDCWTEVAQPTGRPIVVESGDYIFVASPGSGVVRLKLTSAGTFPINEGMKNSESYALALSPGTIGNKNLVAVTRFTNSMFRSTDRGVTWSASANGPGKNVLGLATVLDKGGAGIVIASVADGLWRSADGGLTWGLTGSPSIGWSFVGGVAVIGGNVLAVQMGDALDLYSGKWSRALGIRLSSDGGLSWGTMSLPGTQCDAIGVGPATSEGTSVFVATSTGLYRSTNIGGSWVKVASPTSGNERIISIATNGSALFAIVDGLGVYRSYDNGDTWNQASGGLHIGGLTCLTAGGSQLFAANDGDGVFVSSNDGETWTAINTGLTSLRALSLASDSSELYVGTVSGVFRYTGSLASVASMTLTVPDTVAESTSFWVEVKVGTPNPVKDLKGITFLLASNNPSCQYVDSTAVYGPFMVKETIQGFRLHPSEHYSKPDAQSVSITLNAWAETSGSGVVAKAQFRTSASVSSGDVRFSLVNVRGWDPAGNTIALAPSLGKTRIVHALPEIWPGDCNNNGVVDAADILPMGIYYGQSLGRKNNPGLTWQAFPREDWPGDTLRKKIHADANGDGFINSVDVLVVGLNYGKTHQVVGVPGSTGLGRSVADGMLQIGPHRKSQRSGELLTLPVSLKSTASVYGVAFDLKYGLIGSASTGSVRLLRIDTVGTAFGGGLMLDRISDEEGAADVGITRVQGNGFAGQDVLMNLVFDVPSNSPVWVETSNIVGNDEKGNALVLAGSVFRSDAEGANETSSVPTENALMQNYPNPFNPATTINFQLSDVSAVSLKVFDILGREIVTLVNEEKPAGTFMVRWDASGVPSGIYCFQMTARNKSGQMFTQTRRMTIVK